MRNATTHRLFNRLKNLIFLLLVFYLSGLQAFAQPRFLAFNFYQTSKITSKAKGFPKVTENNAPICFTGLGIGDDLYYWADAGLIVAALGELGGRRGYDPYAPGNGLDLGFLSIAAGKQLDTDDESYTFGAGIDFDARGLGSAAHVDRGMYTIGPSMCLQLRFGKIFTYATVFGFGWGTGSEIQWRNSLSIGYGKLGFNIQPNINRYKKKDNTDPNLKWTITSKFLQFGLSLRLGDD